MIAIPSGSSYEIDMVLSPAMKLVGILIRIQIPISAQTLIWIRIKFYIDVDMASEFHWDQIQF